MKSRMKKRTSPLQTVDEDKVCVSAKVERNEISNKTKESTKQEQSTTIQQRSNKKKPKKKINKFKDEELNQKYELLPKKARKAPFGRCYFALHRDSQNIVLIAMIFQKVFDQFVQGGRGEHELHELMKAADPNLSGFREKMQCAGAVALIMDISSNDKTTQVTRAPENNNGTSSSSSSSSHDVTTSASSKDSPREMTRVDMTTPNSEPTTEIKAKKSKRSRKRVEEKESRSEKSASVEESSSTSQHNKETTSTTHQEVMQKSSESRNISKDPIETRSLSPETSNPKVEAAAQEESGSSSSSYWTNWFMPWAPTKPPPPAAAPPPPSNNNLFQQASEREFYLAETASAGPYDNMMKHQHNATKKKTIQSNYYQGEAWSVVSPGYSDCDVTSRPTAPTPTGSTLLSQDSDDVIMKRIQTVENNNRVRNNNKILQQQEQKDEDDGAVDERDERVEKKDETKEEERVIIHNNNNNNKRIDPEGSHQVDPSFSAKPKEVKGTDDDDDDEEPTKEDTRRISIAAALETRKEARRKTTRKDKQDESSSSSPKNIIQQQQQDNKKRMVVAEKEKVVPTLMNFVPESRQVEIRNDDKKEQETRNAQQITAPVLARDAMSLVSTETVYSADYSSVPPYRLMRPRNLTFCKLITSLELADCMPLGPYYNDYYNVDYDEIFSEGGEDEATPNDWLYRRRDTFYSGDSRSSD